jgi:hypothetical protein
MIGLKNNHFYYESSEGIISVAIPYVLFFLSLLLISDHSSSVSVAATRRAMYVNRYTEARSYNRCCSGKAVSIIYYKDVFVAFGIQYAMHIVVCGLSGSIIFFHII